MKSDVFKNSPKDYDTFGLVLIEVLLPRTFKNGPVQVTLHWSNIPFTLYLQVPFKVIALTLPTYPPTHPPTYLPTYPPNGFTAQFYDGNFLVGFCSELKPTFKLNLCLHKRPFRRPGF